MQQKIVADREAKPLLNSNLLEEVAALTSTARHIRTLLSAVRGLQTELYRHVSAPHDFHRSSEWDDIVNLIAMIEEKADHVDSVAERVAETEWQPWDHPATLHS